MKEMGVDKYQCNMLLKEKEEIEKVIMEIPFWVYNVHLVGTMKTTFAKMSMYQEEIRNSKNVEQKQASQVNIKKEVKDVITKYPTLVRETLDMNKCYNNWVKRWGH